VFTVGDVALPMVVCEPSGVGEGTGSGVQGRKGER